MQAKKKKKIYQKLINSRHLFCSYTKIALVYPLKGLLDLPPSKVEHNNVKRNYIDYLYHVFYLDYE